jgi:hypothetical protein
MNRHLKLSFFGSALLLCLATVPGQATVAGIASALPPAAHATAVTQARWFHHRHGHCWWSHHHRHCR